MKSWFSQRNAPAPGMTDDELPGRAIPPASPACCCPATPAFTAVIPPAVTRRHPVDLLLCGHHYRASQAVLRALGATVHDRSGTLVTPAADGGPSASPRAPAPAGRHQVTR